MRPFRLAALALLFGATMAVAADAPGESSIVRLVAAEGAAPRALPLALNKAAIIELDTDARDVFVANPEIADAVVRTPRRVFILALKLGRTNVFFVDARGRQIATLDVAVGSEDIASAVAQTMPNATVAAAPVNDALVLSGKVSTPQEAAAAQDIATRLTGDPEKVVNMLDIEQRSQVIIKVSVSEMSRTIAKQLGVDVTVADRTGGVPIFASTDNQFSLVGRALADLSGVQVGEACTFLDSVPNCSGPNNVQGVVRALERVGLVHTLAEPNLTAVSGESARFLAGGEFPVPVGRDRDGNITIAFKQFGVGLAFTPVVLSKGRISLQVSTEVSELTNVGSITAGGVTIPGLAVRRAETTVELPSGGSLVIGGLLQNQTKQNFDAFPGLKDLPVLGALFRSRDFANSETELVVMLTAYLANPVQERQLTTPVAGFVPPADGEAILFGRLNAVYGDGKTPITATEPGAVGYIVQ